MPDPPAVETPRGDVGRRLEQIHRRVKAARLDYELSCDPAAAGDSPNLLADLDWAADALSAQAARAETAEKYLRDISVALSDAGCLALTVQGAVTELITQRDDATESADDHDGVMGRLRALLNRAAVALKGPEPPLTMHDWSDIPDRIVALTADRDVQVRAAFMAGWQANHWGDHTGHKLFAPALAAYLATQAPAPQTEEP